MTMATAVFVAGGVASAAFRTAERCRGKKYDRVMMLATLAEAAARNTNEITLTEQDFTDISEEWSK